MQPLDNSFDNPFKGGKIVDYSYILLVNNAKIYRDYGINGGITEIVGDVKVLGQLAVAQQVNLINMKIIGTLSLDVYNGDVVLTNTTASTMFVINRE